MASYDTLRHVSIGQYVPTGSLVHRLDPRSKLLWLMLGIVALLTARGYWVNIGLLLFILGLVRLARLPLRYVLSSVRPALPIITLLAIMQVLFYAGPPGTVWLDWGLVRISSGGVRLMMVSLLRFVDLLCLTSLLTNTTTSGAITQGIESLLRPLSAVGLPGHQAALIVSIALRFLPILGEQMEAIVQAQHARGALVEHGRWAVVANARRAAQLIVPLLVDAYRRADELVLAMRARCYQGGAGRTYLVQLVFSGRDWLSLAAAAALVALTVCLRSLPIP